MPHPAEIVVIRIRTHRVRDGVAEYDFRWDLLGTLQDINWERPFPLKLGPQPEPYVYLLDVLELGLNPDDCRAYIKAENTWSALIREEAFNYNGCTVHAGLREVEEEIMGYLGDKIDFAVSENFHPDKVKSEPPVQEAVRAVQTAPPWAGLYPCAPSDPTDADLYT